MASKGLRDVLGRLRRDPSGEEGESLACRHLEAQGFTILQRNFRCRSGEVDVVALHGETTVFVEVKGRAGRSHGQGYDGVTFGKRRRLVRAARLYAASRGLFDKPLRFDVISIEWVEGDPPRIRHDRGAFDAEGR